MLNQSRLKKLHARFADAYPEYSKAMKSCRTESELKATYNRIYQDAIAKARPYLGAGDGPTGFPLLTLTPSQYQQLITATGDNIEVVATTMLNTASIVQPSWSVGQTTAQFVTAGLCAMGAIGAAAFNAALGTGVVEMVAIAAGIEAVTVAGIVAIVAVAIIAVILPILYFMLKPACCFVVLLNETQGSLTWVDDYNVHGKPIGRVDSIPAAVVVPAPIPGAGTYVVCGFIQTDKRDDALVGTQYGFTYNAGTTPVSFGVECPLTSIYVDNNCYCAINSNSEAAADATDSSNVLSYQCSLSNLNVSINCNSGSGSVAYYIARVRDGSV